MINKYLTNMLRSALLILAATLVSPAFAADDDSATDSPASNMDILREKIIADKKFVVADNMNLTEGEAKAFWPIYDAYQQDLHQINERMAKVINEYALAYNKGAILDKTAQKLLEEAIEVEQAEVKLKQAYVPKLSKVLPYVKVARYMQIENKIRAIIRYELAAAIPLVK